MKSGDGRGKLGIKWVEKERENDRQVNKCIKKGKERDLLMFPLTNQ